MIPATTKDHHLSQRIISVTIHHTCTLAARAGIACSVAAYQVGRLRQLWNAVLRNYHLSYRVLARGQRFGVQYMIALELLRPGALGCQ